MRGKLIGILGLSALVLAAAAPAPRLLAQGMQKEGPPELTLKAGDAAPDFTLRDQNGKEVSLHDFRGNKNVLLAFYIFAFTGGWTTQLQNFQKNLQRLEAADTQVLGISMDSRFSNKAFGEKIGVTFPLLSDWGGDVTRQYGVYNPQYKAARRVNILIDKEGKITEIQLDKDAMDPTRMVEICEYRKPKKKAS